MKSVTTKGRGGSCSKKHADWATLSAHDKKVWSNHVSNTDDLSFVKDIIAVITGATPPDTAAAINAMFNCNNSN
eukprot:2080666-Ditylum_brightwellii.AAC.1